MGADRIERIYLSTAYQAGSGELRTLQRLFRRYVDTGTLTTEDANALNRLFQRYGGSGTEFVEAPKKFSILFSRYISVKAKEDIEGIFKRIREGLPWRLP